PAPAALLRQHAVVVFERKAEGGEQPLARGLAAAGTLFLPPERIGAPLFPQPGQDLSPMRLLPFLASREPSVAAFGVVGWSFPCLALGRHFSSLVSLAVASAAPMRDSENDFEAPQGRLDAWKSMLACGKCPERTGSSVVQGPFGGRIAPGGGP